ncbi:MAG: hypothetical protein ACOCUY_03070 [Verrucomicrobiota bacterium]
MSSRPPQIGIHLARGVRIGCIAAIAFGIIPVRAQDTSDDSLIPAILTADEQKRKVYLVSRDEDTVRFKEKRDSRATIGLPVNKLEDIYVRLDYDRGKVFSAAQKGEWRKAAQILLPVIKPHLDYLDIPGHEAVDAALRTGVLLFHEGMRVSELALEQEKRAEASRYFKGARHIFRQCQEAQWWEGAEDAQYRALLCTILLDELEEADDQLKFGSIPPADARGAGTYWLAAAYREYIRGDTRAAATAATRSLLFQNKDLGTFPYALFLNGICNEELEYWYRARDAHFEAARLFYRFPAGAAAMRHLIRLIESGHIDEEEQQAAQSIFFRGKDDIRERIQNFLDMTDQSVQYAEKSGQDDEQSEAPPPDNPDQETNPTKESTKEQPNESNNED